MRKDEFGGNVSLKSYLLNVLEKLEMFIKKCDEWIIVFNNNFRGVESDV